MAAFDEKDSPAAMKEQLERQITLGAKLEGKKREIWKGALKGAKR